MQQKSLSHKTALLSKILMGTAMVGFFGIFSPNTAAKAQYCHHLQTQQDCENTPDCHWFSYGPSCGGGAHCYGLDETTCSQTAGCHMSEAPTGIKGFCVDQYVF